MITITLEGEQLEEHNKLTMERLSKMMEEMANAPKEEYGKRQPGERGKYETSRTPIA